MTKEEQLKKAFSQGQGWDYKNEKVLPEDAIYEQVFGAGRAEPFNWIAYLPEKESQGSTTFCVTYSALNCAETRAKQRGYTDEQETEINLSDRNLGVISGTNKVGNNLNKVAETFRKEGVVKEKECQWKPEWLENQTKYWNEIFDLSDVSPEARYFKGPNHSWVANDIQGLKNALADSPLQLGFGVGETWFDDIVTPPKKIEFYHAVECYYIDSKYIYINDSVFPALKKLTLNYPVLMAKSFRELPSEWKELNKKKMTTEKLNQIYNELLVRDADSLADGYLGYDEEFVRAEVGESEERKRIIRIIELARELGGKNLEGIEGVIEKLR